MMRGFLISSLALLMSATAWAQNGVVTDEVLERIPPQYPQIGGAYGINATCDVLFNVTEEGIPTDVCVACNTSVSDQVPASVADYVARQFVLEAEAAVTRWRYTGIPGGRQRVATQVNFQIVDDEVPEDQQTPMPAGPGITECQGTPIT